MDCTRGLKLHDLNLSFLVLSGTNIGSKTFFALIMEGIDTLRLFKFGMSPNNCDATATISYSVSIFLSNASLIKGLVNFIFHVIIILHFDNKLAF